MRTFGYLVCLGILVIAICGCNKPAPATSLDLPPPPPSTPLNSEKLKKIATLVDRPKAEWLQALGEPDREDPPGDTMPRDGGDTVWGFDDNMEMDVSWLKTKAGVLPWGITFQHVGGDPDASLVEMDFFAEFFGLSRSKSDDLKGNYEWSRPDGLLSATYHKWGAGDSDFGGLQIEVEKPGGEPVPDLDEAQQSPTKKAAPKR